MGSGGKSQLCFIKMTVGFVKKGINLQSSSTLPFFKKIHGKGKKKMRVFFKEVF